jgi:hypothetical protein
MSGSALEVFTDFYNRTGPTILTGPDKFIIEAVEHGYLLKRFAKGSDFSRVVQGGNKIRDEIMFDEDNTGEFYHPGATFTWQMPQVLTTWEIPWRFLIDHAAWTKQDVELQLGPGPITNDLHSRFHALVRGGR